MKVMQLRVNIFTTIFWVTGHNFCSTNLADLLLIEFF